MSRVAAHTGMGLDTVWEKVGEHREALDKAGELATRRADQQVDWMWQMVRDRLMDRLLTDPDLKQRLPELTRDVRGGGLTPTLAAQTILDALR